MTGGLVKRAALGSIVALFAAAPANAQDISGSIRDTLTSAPVRGAVVMVLAANREPIVRRLSSSSGAFRVPVGSGAVLRVIKIGYLPFEKPIAQLGASPLVIEMMPAGRMIAPVAVRSGIVCPARNDQREALALWSQATDALLAMVVATGDSAHNGLLTQILYDRLFVGPGPRIQRQSSRRVVTGNVLPIRADRNPEEFVENGYVVTTPRGSTYYAPDPETLLDSSFAATHCLSRRAAPRGDTTRIGVAFEPPYDRRNIPDIGGVLWLTREPLALHSLEFEYRGVPQVVLNMFAGGRLQFETLSDGIPIISSWHVRSPRLAYLRDGRPVVAEVHENGGLIADGVLSDGTSWTAPLATLRGRVSNIVTDQPVRDALVVLDSTDQEARTDSAGRFYFEQLLPGPHVLRIKDSLPVYTMRVNDAGDLVPDSSIVMQWVTRTATTDLNVQIGLTPFVETALPWREPHPGCGRELPEGRFGVIGAVLNASNRGVPDARVRLSWADTSRGVVLQTAVDAKADFSGGFILCGIPADRTLGSQVVGPGGQVHLGTTRISRRDPDGDPNVATKTRAVTLRIPGQ